MELIRRKQLASVCVIGICLLLAPFGSIAEAPRVPAHAPSLLFNAAGIQQLRARIRKQPGADQWEKFKSRYDTSLNQPIDLPPRGSNWFHWYVCPRHGVRLKEGKQIAAWKWEHICPVDSEVFYGDPARPERDFDGVALSSIHQGYADAIRDLGILYQVTGDSTYAKRGRDILMAYADRYASYPLHNIHGEAKIGGGKVGPQTLDEAVWLIPVAQGADLLWNTLTEEERKKLADDLFLPAARDVILPHKMGIHNIQCWKNSAVGLVGFLLHEEPLIHAAIDDPQQGFRAQMEKGVTADGSWYEGAWGYHFYTLKALWPLAEAARNNGIDLYGTKLARMFDAPVELAMPNLRLPAFNDSVEIDTHNPIYELAYARYRNPLYLLPLRGLQRDNAFALWFGADPLPASKDHRRPDLNAEAGGFADLQQGEGADATWISIKYGLHGGGHGHPDKNNFVLYSRGRVLFPDPGTRPYGSKLHQEWDRVTVAHNTLVVDGSSQRPATGRSLAFGTEHGIPYSMTDAGAIYPGVRFVRTVLLLNRNVVLFIDQVAADESHAFDLALHHVGKFAELPEGGAAALQPENGYQHLSNATVRESSSGARLLMTVRDGWQSAVYLAPDGVSTRVITATGIGESTEDHIPAILFRRVAKNTDYVWAVSLDGRPVSFQNLTNRGGKLAVSVKSGDESWGVAVDRDAAKVSINQ